MINSKREMGDKVSDGLPRWFELPLALMFLFFISPLLVLIALVIKLTSKGSVLFQQERVGRFGKNFILYKFRTMRDSNDGPQVTVKKDKRITWIGSILRRTKVDELPELWNIVRGDMSIVGARPEVPKYVSLDDALWCEVLQSRPGITDPVTLRLRNEEEMLASAKDPVKFYLEVLQPEKLKGYLSYLRTRTWKSDLLVIKDTLVAIVFPFESPPPTLEEEHAHIEIQQQQTFIQSLIGFGRLRMLADVSILIFAFIFSYLLRFEFSIPNELLYEAFLQMVVVVTFQYLILHISGISKFIWRYISLEELGTFVRAAVFSSLPFIVFRLLKLDYLTEIRVPLSITLMDSLYAFGGLMGIRILRRVMFERYAKRKITTKTLSVNRKPVYLIGAGRSGQIAAKEITGRGDSNFVIKGFIDDDPEKQGKIIVGIKVCGTTKDLSRLSKASGVENAILTISHARAEDLQRIVSTCEEAELNLRIMPGLYKLIDEHEPAENNQMLNLKVGA